MAKRRKKPRPAARDRTQAADAGGKPERDDAERDDAERGTEGGAPPEVRREGVVGWLASHPRRRLLLPALACLSGVMWFLACADWDIWPLGWVAMVPGLLVIETAPTVRRATLYGWLVGIVGNVGGFYWITGLLSRFGHLPMPLAIL